MVEVVLIKLIHKLCVVSIGDQDFVELCKSVCGPNSLAHIIILREVLCYIHIDVLWVVGECVDSRGNCLGLIGLHLPNGHWKYIPLTVTTDWVMEQEV